MTAPESLFAGVLSPYYQDDFVTLYHADCLKWLPKVAPSLLAYILVTDPPYGIDFESGWTGAAIAGDATTEARDRVLAIWLQSARAALVFGTPFSDRLPAEVARLVWWRRGSGMGNLDLPWKPDYEAVHVFGEGFSAPVRGSSVLDYKWDEFRGTAGHPHRKPVSLMRDLIGKCPPGPIIDPFAGSGSTLVAAKQLGRLAVGIEIKARYCALAASRLAQDALLCDRGRGVNTGHRTTLRGPFPLCSRGELQEMLDETDETIDRLRTARPVSVDHAARIAEAVDRQRWWAAGIRAQLEAEPAGAPV